MADMRKCIGSTKFGIEAHEAPPEDFPVQPSQKDGLGRMCKPHWSQYVTALRKAALARAAAADEAATEVAPTEEEPAAAKARAAKKPVSAKPARKPEPIRTRPARRTGKTDGEPIAEAVDMAVARDAANVAEASIG